MLLNSDRRTPLCVVFLLLLVASRTASAQPARYELSLMGGYTLPNTPEWAYVSSSTAELSAAVAWQLSGEHYWTPLRREPLFGLRAGFLHAHRAIAGNRLGLQGFLQQPLWISPDRRSQLAWNLDVGMSLFSQPHSFTDNPDNIFIGSLINCLINIGFRFERQVTPHGVLGLGLGFSHASNGYLRKPNQGLNYLHLAVSWGWLRDTSLHTPRPQPEDSTSILHLPASHAYISYAPGLVQARNGIPDNLYFYTHTAQVGYLFNLSPIRALGANVDLMFNYSHYAIADAEGIERPFPLYVGLASNYETAWNRFLLRLSVGTYLLKSPLVTMPIYERVGIYYRFGNRLHQYAGVSFKAHYAHVDYIEWTYGIELF